MNDLLAGGAPSPSLFTIGEQRPLGMKKAIIEPPPIGTVAALDGAFNVHTLVGFFQSLHYFEDFEELVREVLIDPSLAATGRRVVESAYGGGLAGNAIYVALHIRRGDYLKYSDTFETLPLDYYECALHQLLGPLLCMDLGIQNLNRSMQLDRSSSPIKVLIFSDDIHYASGVCSYFRGKYSFVDTMVVDRLREEAAGIHATTFIPTPMTPISHNSPQEDPVPLPRDVLELYMMAACHDVVMANSTFSWWGAYLGERKLLSRSSSLGTPAPLALGRVVAPSKWFVKEPYPQAKHLYNKGWLVI